MSIATVFLDAWNKEVDRYARAKTKKNPNQPYLFQTEQQGELDDLGPGHWITIGADKSRDGEHHGGHHVYLGDDGKMKTGKFAGQSMTEAFGNKTKQKPKREKQKLGQGKLFGTEEQENLPGFAPGKEGSKPKAFEPTLLSNEREPKPNTSDHQALLDRAAKFRQYGPDYRRNIADPAARLESAMKRGHDPKMLDHLASELEQRLPGEDDPSMKEEPEPTASGLSQADEDSIRKMAPGANKRQEQEQQGRDANMADLKEKNNWARNHIKIAADDVQSLRKSDVYRVLDAVEDDNQREFLSQWIGKQRKELWPEIHDSNADIDEERERDRKKQELRSQHKEIMRQQDLDDQKKDPARFTREWAYTSADAKDLHMELMNTDPEFRRIKDAADEEALAAPLPAEGEEYDTPAGPAETKYLDYLASEQAKHNPNRTPEYLRDYLQQRQAATEQATPKQSSPGIIEGSTKVANEDAQAGDQLGLFGEGEKAKKKGWQPSLLDDTKGKQQALFDTAGDKDQMLMFDDGVTPEDRIGKVEQNEASKQPGVEFETVGGENDGKKGSLPFPSFTKSTQREQAEKIQGGKAAGKPDESFDQGELDQGQQTEMEHTSDPDTAKEIAKDHLTEDPKYYDKLAKMEGKKGDDKPASSKHDVSTLDGYKSFMSSVDKGEVTADQLKQAHADFLANREAIRADLSKMKKDDIVGWHHEEGIQAFSYGADRMTKDKLIESKLNDLESEFNKTSDSLSYNPFGGESLSDVRRKAIGSTTDDHLQAHAEKHKEALAKREASRKAFTDSLENPKTAQDWVRKRRMSGGYDKLSHEEKTAYDDALAAHRRETYPSAPQKEREIKGFSGGTEATGNVGIVEGHHKKRDKPTWTVTLEEHLGDNWKEALSRAKQMGGNYVNTRIAKAYGATPGFQFFDKESAESFKKVLGGESHDISDKVDSEAEERRQRQADSLLERAERIEGRGENKLNAPRQDNTARRARIARGMEDDARKEIAKAKTLRALANHVEDGKSKNLNGVRAARHAEELDTQLMRAKQEAISLERKNNPKRSWDQEERRWDSPAKAEDIAHTKYPYPQIYKADMERTRKVLSETPGLKHIAAKVGKWQKEAFGSDFKQITDSKDIAAIQKALPKMRRHRDPAVRSVAESLGHKFDSYNRLQSMDIKSLPELRAALREYHSLKENPEGADPIKEKIRDLKRDKTPGFFPTPSGLSQRVVELAQIGEGHSVLEPSAGIGNLMDAIKEQHPDVNMHGIEQKFDFADVLQMKGHKHERGDFLQHDKQYDRIVMNPPFENRQDEKHVQHAYKLLKPGGRMVAITGAGAHTNQRSEKFRDWLSEVGGKVVDLDEGQFMADDAVKKTGVNTKLVIIEKPDDSSKYSFEWSPALLESERYNNTETDQSQSRWQPTLLGA